MATSTSSPSQAKSQDTVAPISVKLAGRNLDPTLANKLVEVVVKKARMLPDMAYVRFADPMQKLVDAPPAKIGDEIEILAGGPMDRAPKSLFKGVVTAYEPDFRDDGVFVAFRAYDKGHSLTKTRNTRTFQNQTIADIVKSVVGSSLNVDVQPTGSPLEYMMQSNESDWDFVWRLASTIGYELVSDGDKAKFRKVGGNDGAGPWLQYGQAEAGHRLLSFRPRVSDAELPANVSAKYVNTRGEVIQAKARMAEGKMSTAGKSIAGFELSRISKGKGDFAITDIIAKDESELRKKVEAKRDLMLARAVEAEGLAEGNADLKPGAEVEIRGIGRFSGKYLLSECVHLYRGGAGFKTRFSIAARPKTLLTAVAPGAGPMTANGGSGGGGRGGSGAGSIVQGTVTNINDPEKLGRVRVSLPTMASGSDPESSWARVTTNSAGKERGIFMLPQVGDKVIVGFESGDMRKPFILGSVWDGKAPPGKDLVQDDGSFSLKSDRKVLMKAKEDFEFVTDKAWTAKANKAITFESVGDAFTIKAGKEIVIKAPNIKIEADVKVEIKSAQFAVNGTAMVELKAPQITVGGGMVKLG